MRLLPITSDYLRLPPITSDYLRLPPITSDYLLLLFCFFHVIRVCKSQRRQVKAS